MAPISGHHYSAKTQALTSACFVRCAQLEAGDVKLCFPLLSEIMQSPLMLPSLGCRRSQPEGYTSTEKPCGWGGNDMQVTDRLHVHNVNIFVYERIAPESANFICILSSSCVKSTQVFLCEWVRVIGESRSVTPDDEIAESAILHYYHFLSPLLLLGRR